MFNNNSTRVFERNETLTKRKTTLFVNVINKMADAIIVMGSEKAFMAVANIIKCKGGHDACIFSKFVFNENTNKLLHNLLQNDKKNKLIQFFNISLHFHEF